jgi:uncharacterized RDD family membrane protein YckC
MQMPKPACEKCGAVLDISSGVRSSARQKVTSVAFPEEPSVRPLEKETAGTALCSECGMELSEDELIRLGDHLVCATCKPFFVQKLREGVNVGGEMVYAGFWIRVGARFIDGIILGIPQFALFFFGIPLFALRSSGISTASYVLTYAIFEFISIGLSIAYPTYFVGKFGATPGKMACGLRVVRPDGEKVSYARAFGRVFGEFVSAVILCIGYLMVAFDGEKRALHDRICDTRVVKKA